jgi:insertion element IS1 protein InsB
MNCRFCKGKCQKAGRQKNGAQKLYCRPCGKYSQVTYRYTAWHQDTSVLIRSLVCEGVGIRSIRRILQIGINTVVRRIVKMAGSMVAPQREQSATWEVDELWTYIGRKENEYWIAYALNRRTRQVVDFIIGKRTKATLKELIDRLLLSKPKVIRTDRLTIYQRIIPKGIHRSGSYCINRIERKNLSIRTHLKRLRRRTICFSRNITMLESCLKLYFWQ